MVSGGLLKNRDLEVLRSLATALGYGSALTSGKALQSYELRGLFALDRHDEPLCFISVGSVTAQKAGPARPAPGRYVNELGDVPQLAPCD